MALSKQAWHNRFLKQARWTQSLRNHLYRQAKIDQAQRVLEVGCGSGAVLGELSHYTGAMIFGLDIDPTYLSVAMRNTRDTILFQADAHHIPIASSNFDLSFCHFLLLWVNDSLQVLREMVRVTRPGGFVCALAEPDYGGRIDFPTELANLGQSQTQALRRQGAHPEIGRQLRSLLTSAGLVEVVSGVLGGKWELPFDQEEWDSEWEILEADLGSNPEFQASKHKQKAQDLIAWTSGERILYVPTFYAWGIVPV